MVWPGARPKGGLNMGNQAIILMILTALTGALLMYADERDAYDAEVVWASYQAKVTARAAALEGLDRTLEKLQQHTGSWHTSSEYHMNLNRYNDGYYWTRVSLIDSNEVDIMATGVVSYNDELGMPSDTVHVILARYERKAGGNTPDIDFLEAVRVNAILTTEPVLKAGIKVYTGPVPNVNMDVLRQKATLIETGPFALNGSTVGINSFPEWAASIEKSAGTENNPFILLVDGHLVIEDRLDVSGYGILAATEGITVRGSITDNLNVKQEPTLLLVTPTEIVIEPEEPDNFELTSTLYAEREVVCPQTCALTGSIITQRFTIPVGSTPHIIHAKPNTALIYPAFNITPDGIVLTAYSEW